MMKILILTTLYPNPWQPHRAPFNRQQFAALAQRHDVRLIAPVAWTDEWRSAYRGRHVRTILREAMIVDHPRFIFPPKLLRSLHGQCYLRSARAAFDQVVREFRPQVILASWAYPDGWAAVKLAGAANLPVAIKVHGSDVLLHRRPRTIEALRSADAVIAVSRQLAGKATDLGVEAARVHVVYNGIDDGLFCPGPTKLNQFTEPLVLFVGNLAAVKCLDVLIRACGLLRDRRVRFACRIIGQGPLRAALSRQIETAGLNSLVQLIGPRTLEELPDWYRAAGVLVMPSRSEGIPNVILEAQACGTPVVATRVGGIPEVLEEQAMVPPHDPAALARAIEDALSRPRGSACKARSWSASAGQLAGVLAQAAEGRRQVAA
jgi:glycosyltransferase involved in cell wall biosynthesis